MAGQRQQRCFSLLIIRPFLALAATALICAASTTAQQQPQLPPSLPKPPNMPACPPPQATLFPCISYLIGNSSSPATACCSQIQAMFESQAPCLCAAMAAAPSQLGAAFGAAQAMLPGACSLPPNACSGAGGAGPSSTTPASAGTGADAPAPATADLDPTAAGGGGLKSVPGLLGSDAAAGYGRGISAAAVLMISGIVACLL